MTKRMFIFIVALIFILLGVQFLLFAFRNQGKTAENSPTQSSGSDSQSTSQVQPKDAQILSHPISNAKIRITKKPFGIYITPQSSPIKPEKFTGYHTGTDFETMAQEKKEAVSVYSFCTGKIRAKQIVSGYGGVIVQDCAIEGQTATVLYGHIDIRKSNVQISQEVKGGERLSVLAQAYSQYSGGERKHLHLGIHRGSSIDYRGYVQNKSELLDWIDVQKYLN